MGVHTCYIYSSHSNAELNVGGVACKLVSEVMMHLCADVQLTCRAAACKPVSGLRIHIRTKVQLTGRAAACKPVSGR